MKNNFLDTNIIFENKFSQKILLLSGNIAKNDKLDEKETFIMEVFNRFYEIYEKFSDINYSYLHILNYPSSLKYKKIFPIQKYNIYHTEIYTMKIIALFDRFLHLINFLYELGLIKNGLNLKEVKKTKKVNESILIILDEFDKKIQPIRVGQNNFKHEGSLDIPELQRVNVYELLLNHSDNVDEKQKKAMKLYIKLEYKKYKGNHKEKLLENTKGIAKFVNKILDELYTQFKDRLNTYK